MLDRLPSSWSLRALAVVLLIAGVVGCDFGGKPKKRTAKKSTASTPVEGLSWPPPQTQFPSTPAGTTEIEVAEAPAENRPRTPITTPAPAKVTMSGGPAAAPLTTFVGRELFAEHIASSEAVDAPIADAAFLPNGAEILLLTGDGDVRVHDATTYELKRSFNALPKPPTVQADRPTALAIDPAGQRVAVATQVNVFVLDLAAAKPIYSVKVDAKPITDVEFAVQGTQLLAQAGIEAFAWNAADGKPIYKLGQVGASRDRLLLRDQLDLTADRSALMTINSGVFRLLDLHQHGAPIASFNLEVWDPTSTATSPDGKLLALLDDSFSDKFLAIYSLPEGRPLTKVVVKSKLTALSFARDGRTVIGTGDGLVVVDAPTGELLLEQAFPTGEGRRRLAIDPKRDLFAAFNWNGQQRVRFYSLVGSAESQRISVLPTDSYWEPHIAAADDGKTVAIEREKKLMVWDGSANPPREVGELEMRSMAFAPQAKKLFGVNWDKVTVWEPPFDKPTKTFEKRMEGSTLIPGTTRMLGQPSYNETGLKIFDLTSPENPVQTLEGSTLEGVQGVGYSGDGKTMALADSRGKFELWDLAAGTVKRTWYGDPNGVKQVVVSQDGKRVGAIVANRVEHIWLFNAETGEKLVQWRPAFENQKAEFVIFAGSHFIAGAKDGRLRIWGRDAQPSPAVLPAHRDGITGLSSCAPLERFATSGKDQTVKMWDVADVEKALASLPIAPPPGWSASEREPTEGPCPPTRRFEAGPKPVDGNVDLKHVAVSSDGKWIAAGGIVSLPMSKRQGRVCVWKADSLELVHVFDSPRYGVEFVSFTPDGQRIVALTRDDVTGVVYDPAELRVWNLTDGREGTPVPVPGDTQEFKKMNAPGALLTMGASRGGEHALSRWDLNTLKPVVWNSFNFQADSLAVSPDGQLISASGLRSGLGGGVQLVVDAQANGLWSIEKECLIFGQAFDAKSERLAGSGMDTRAHQMLRIWEAKSGTLIHQFNDLDWHLTYLAWSPDGAWLAGSGYLGGISLFDAKTYKRRRRVTESGIGQMPLAFSPDGKQLLGVMGSELRLWTLDDLLSSQTTDTSVAKLEDAGFVVRNDDFYKAGVERGLNAQFTVARPEQQAVLAALEGAPIEGVYLGSSHGLPGGSLNVLKTAPRLRVVNLFGCRELPESAVLVVAKLPKLEFLNLSSATPRSGESFSVGIFEALAEAPHLKALDLGGLQIDDSHVAPLAKCVGLVDLDLRSTRLPAASLTTLSKLTKLRRLSINSMELEGVDLSPLLECVELEQLDLNYSRAGEAEVAKLAALPKLKELKVYGTELSEATKAAMLKKLPTLKIDN